MLGRKLLASRFSGQVLYMYGLTSGILCFIVFYFFFDGAGNDRIVSTKKSFFAIPKMWNMQEQLVTDSLKPAPGTMHDKWIVVTSIALPTEDVKYLASLKGWKVLVVGDKITPAEWSYPNCVFLSVEDQKSLGYKIHALLPYGSYSRKNMGYLYAIQHGAKVVYETDDDNRPLDKLKGFLLEPEMSGLMFAGSDVFNPYRHFGQSSIWPRGYSLTNINNNTSHLYRLSTSWKTPLMQQGIVNGDPDVDAIFRLTRKSPNYPLNVTFDPSAPPVIVPRGVFSPTNAQNTLFLHGAFWAMLIPTTTTFRVCDIWRAYWSQRLMWEIGGRIGFFPPNAFQKRNAHNYLADAKDEDQVYFDTHRLLSFLRGWSCPADFGFFQCIRMLSAEMAENAFWQKEDSDLTAAWLEDLLDMGYPEPTRVYFNADTLQEKVDGYEESTDVVHTLSCLEGSLDGRVSASMNAPKESSMFASFTPVEMEPPITWRQRANSSTQLTEHIVKLSHVCKNQTININTSSIGGTTGKHFDFFNDILVIVIFHYPFYDNVKFIEAIYSSLFPKRVYCGVSPESFDKATRSLGLQLSFIEAPVNGGCFPNLCAIRAMQMGYKVSGFFVTHDDVLINPWNFPKLNKSRIWATTGNRTTLRLDEQRDTYLWSKPKIGFEAFNKTLSELRTVGVPKGVPSLASFLDMSSENTGEPRSIMAGLEDTYFVPWRLKEAYLWYMTAMTRNSLFHEISTQAVLHGIESRKNIEKISGSSRWGPGTRDNMWGLFRPDQHYLHPFKLSYKANVERLCKEYLPLLLHGIYG